MYQSIKLFLRYSSGFPLLSRISTQPNYFSTVYIYIYISRSLFSTVLNYTSISYSIRGHWREGHNTNGCPDRHNNTHICVSFLFIHNVIV